MKTNIDVTCKFDKEAINITTATVIGDLQVELSRQVMNLQEQQIRNALIELGWTPPAPQDGDAKVFHVETYYDNGAGNVTRIRVSPNEYPEWLRLWVLMGRAQG